MASSAHTPLHRTSTTHPCEYLEEAPQTRGFFLLACRGLKPRRRDVLGDLSAEEVGVELNVIIRDCVETNCMLRPRGLILGHRESCPVEPQGLRYPRCSFVSFSAYPRERTPSRGLPASIVVIIVGRLCCSSLGFSAFHVQDDQEEGSCSTTIHTGKHADRVRRCDAPCTLVIIVAD